MKKLILALLTCAVLFILPVSVYAATETGSCGTNLTWTLTDAGVLTISGMGEMDNFTYEDAGPWDNTKVKEVVISSGVMSVGSHAFRACPNLASVSFPSTLKTIEIYAFSECDSLTEINVPANVTNIYEGAFYCCSGLITATINAKVEVIPYNTFHNCTSLKTLTFPEGLQTIAFSACMGCESLKDLVLPEGLKTIGDYAFYNSIALTNVVIPDSVMTISETAFELPNGKDFLDIYCYSGSEAANYADDRGYEKVLLDELIVQPTFILPVDTASIEANAFENDKKIIAVKAGGCSSVGDEAFKGCTGLKQIQLPADCTISESAFSGCGKIYVIAPLHGSTWIFCLFDDSDSIVFVDSDMFSRLFPDGNA